MLKNVVSNIIMQHTFLFHSDTFILNLITGMMLNENINDLKFLRLNENELLYSKFVFV